MLFPAFGLLDDAPAVCDEGRSSACDVVYNATGSVGLAHFVDWAVQGPLPAVGAILVLIIVALVLRWLAYRLIDRLVARAETGVMPSRFSRGVFGTSAEHRHTTVSFGRRSQRAKSLGGLLKSMVTGALMALVVIMSIARLGYEIGPLIAGAGILGLAFGFGAQTLVKDFLSGIFMLFEDQYGVGDVVDVGEASGTVEAVGLRVTRLRDVDGTVWYVRNGEIVRVGNMSQNWARTVLDVRVPYEADLVRVKQVLADVAEDLWDDEDYRGRILEQPEVWGVEALDPDQVIVRVTLKTAPLEQWAVAREMRQRIKARFDYEGIEMPLPQRVVWHRSSHEDAEAQAAAHDGRH